MTKCDHEGQVYKNLHFKAEVAEAPAEHPQEDVEGGKKDEEVGSGDVSRPVRFQETNEVHNNKERRRDKEKKRQKEKKSNFRNLKLFNKTDF